MRVGIASGDITPTEPVYMAGFSARTEPSEGAYQPLLCRVLVLDDGDHRLVWVTADILGFYEELSEPLTPKLAAATGTEAQWVLLSGSHTHCGPAYRSYDRELWGEGVGEMVGWLVDRITPIAAAAVEDLREGSLHYSLGRSEMGIHRRRLIDGEMVMAPNVEGPIDPDVPVLQVRGPEGELRAVLCSYACHPTTMGGQLLGPDYVGFLRAEVEPRVDAPVLFANGCGGDIKPRNINDQNRFASGPLEAVERCGRQLGADVLAALEQPTERLGDKLELRREVIELPFQPPHAREVYEEASTSGRAMIRRWGENVLAAIDAGESFRRGTPFTVQALRVGEGFVIVSLGGEVCCEIGLRIKRELRRAGREVMVVAYSHRMFGYQASRREFSEGGYEVESWAQWHGYPAPYQPDIEDQIVQTAGRLVDALG